MRELKYYKQKRNREKQDRDHNGGRIQLFFQAPLTGVDIAAAAEHAGQAGTAVLHQNYRD